ncbi:hypothetical protein FB446DRAFT_791131 [Lentinula raphanica]|nr:hypothetical protein C8R42DRAFT_728038 [Lentinula raphanica]KAJ3769711.1 hypothetical protein FB446DRAFT_791131 [Lentinula raphanica]
MLNTVAKDLEESEQASPSLATPAPAILTRNGLPLPILAAGTPTAHPVSASFVDFLEGTATISIPSSHVSTNHYMTHPMFQAFVDFFDGPITVARPSSTTTTSSESVASSLSHVSTNHYMTHPMFQAFVDFFDGPITVARPSSTTTTSSESVASSLSGSLMDDLSAPSLTMASPVSIAPPASDGFLMNSRVSLIMCVVTVSTVVLFIWPALRAKRLRETRIVLKHTECPDNVQTAEHELGTALME